MSETYSMLDLAVNNCLKYLKTTARVKLKIYCLSELVIIFIYKYIHEKITRF